MEILKDLFLRYGIALNDFQIKQFEEYFSMLIETNKVMNLTAITDENDVVVKHFLDSVLPYKFFPENAKVIDVGSGAGFPSIPLKIVRPDLQIVMIDSLNKRVNFLNDVIQKLNLQNAFAEHYRAEDYAKKCREQFDVAVARAVAPLNTLVEYLLPLVKVGGKAIIYKSARLDDELKWGKTAISVLGAELESVTKFEIEENGEKIERNILTLKKIKNTPQKYPRDKNKPKLNPIS